MDVRGNCDSTHAVSRVIRKRAVVDVHGRIFISDDRTTALKIVPFPAAGHGAHGRVRARERKSRYSTNKEKL